MPDGAPLLARLAVVAQACSGGGPLPADALQRVLQILRVGAGEVDPLTAAGVLKPEPDRVQPLPLQAELLGQHWVRAVGHVAGTGMVKRREVNPDLVGTPSLKVYLHERGGPKRLNDLVVSDACLAAGYHRELVVVVGVAPDRSVDGAGQRVRQALNKRMVGLVDSTLLERPRSEEHT